MLKIEHISKSFDNKKILKDISFEIKKGKVVALLGENGAGKSTLLRILSGYLNPNAGMVVLDGIGLFEQRLEYLQCIGYVQEISALYDNMTVYDFLVFVADLHKIATDKVKHKIFKTVEQIDLQDVLWKKCGTLSKGYKKRVELATVLLTEPKLMILDEPTEGLDPTQKELIRKLIRKYAKNNMVIISTHTLEDVEAMADDILVLHRGILIANCSIKDFKQNNKSILASFQKVIQE